MLPIKHYGLFKKSKINHHGTQECPNRFITNFFSQFIKFGSEIINCTQQDVPFTLGNFTKEIEVSSPLKKQNKHNISPKQESNQ